MQLQEGATRFGGSWGWRHVYWYSPTKQHRRVRITVNIFASFWARLRAWLDLDSESFDETQDDSWGEGK